MSTAVAAPPLVELARDAGAYEALRALHAQLAPGGLACGASGWTIACDDEQAIARVIVGERSFDVDEVALTVCRAPALRHAGLVAVHAVAHGAGAPHPPTGLAREAGRLRLGLALGLVESVREHVARRSVGGAPLVRQQLVKGLLAEATLDLLAAGAQLDGAAAPAPGLARADGDAALARRDAALPAAAVARAHGAITRAGRTLAGLLGASGYLADGPGATLHVSELVENVCVEAPRTPREPAS